MAHTNEPGVPGTSAYAPRANGVRIPGHVVGGDALPAPSHVRADGRGAARASVPADALALPAGERP